MTDPDGIYRGPERRKSEPERRNSARARVDMRFPPELLAEVDRLAERLTDGNRTAVFERAVIVLLEVEEQLIRDGHADPETLEEICIHDDENPPMAADPS